MPDSTKSMLSGIYEMGKSVREYIDQNGGGGGGGGGSNILAQGTYYAGIAELRNGLNISSVTKTNVGIFDIVFDIPISNREYNVLATPIGTSLINVYVDSSNEDGFEIVTRHNDSHARTDASFDFVVFGVSGAGGGSISSDNLYQTYLDKNSKVQINRLVNANVSPDSYLTLFNYNSDKPIYIYGGTYQNSFSWNPEITIDGVIVSEDEGLIVGQDERDDDISVVHIPPLYATGQVFIRMFNDSVHTQEVGGYVTYSTGNDIQTIDVQGGGGSSTFAGLTDTPSTLTEGSGQYLKVSDDGQTIEYVDLPAGSIGGSSYEFCKLPINSTQYSQGSTNRWLSFDGDPLTGSADWKYLDTNTNTWGIKPDKPGYYNIDAAYKINFSSNNSLTSELQIKLYKRNINTNAATIIGYGTEFFDEAAGYNGPKVEADIQNIYLTDEEVITARTWAYRNGTTTNHTIEKSEAYTYLNVSRADIGGGGSSTFAGLTDTPSTLTEGSGQYLKVSDDGQTIEYVDLPAGSIGGSSSTTLPAGSVLQKVVSSFPDITSLSTVGTEIASMDITPKSSDSQLLCEITFLWQEQGTNGSQQQGKFYIDDVEFGGQWYNHISLTDNRLQTSLRSIATISDTNTKTISHKLTLDSLDHSRIGSIVMSVTEIAQSDYTLAGGGGGGSSSTNIIFKSDINTMTAGAVGTQLNVPHVPTTDTYSAWDSSNNVWVAPKNMTVLVSCNNKASENHLNFYGWIYHGNSFVAQEGSVKSSINSTHSALNLSAVINLQAGDNVSNSVMVQGAGSSTNLNQQIMTITELSGGTGGGGSSSSNYEFCKVRFAANQPSVGNVLAAPINLDSSALEQQSEDWTFLSPVHNKIGIKIPEDGLYNIIGEALVDLSDSTTRSDWQQFVVNHSYEIRDENNNKIAFSDNNKSQNNGDSLKADLYSANVFLSAGTILTAHTAHYRAGGGGNYVYSTDASYLNIEKAESGSGGGGSSSTNGSVGGIGSDADVIAKSNFSKLFPDRINVPIIRDSKTQERYFTFEGFFNRSAPNDMVQYEWNIGGSERFNITFKNNANGDWDAYTEQFDTANTDIDFSKIPSAITNQPTLKEFIDANRAIYLGGGGSSTFAGLTDTPSTLTEGSGQYLKVSDDGQTIEYVDLPAGGGSGGIGDSAEVINLSNFSGKIPDIIQFAASQGPVSYQFRYIQSNNLQFYDVGGNGERFRFNNDASGTFLDTNSSYSRYAGDTTLQSIIDNGHAIYLGGGGSSTFSASSYQENILQDHISTDNDANLNDLHFTGLETGAYYKLGGQVRFVAGFDNAGANMWLYAYQDSFATDNIVAALNNRAGGEADPVNATHTFNHIFQATGDLFFAAGGMNSSQDRYIYGDGSKTQTYVQLEKLGSSSNGDGGGGGSSTFAGLTDTPSTLTEGSGQYLKVSDDGQTIEYVDLPAGSIGGSSSGGGINSNPAISALSNFTGILPDSILLNNNNGSHTTFDIYSIDTDDIQYRSTYDNHQRVTFDNDPSGAFDLSLSITNNYPWISGQPNCLQDMIDDGLAIFAGGGAGGGGGGSTILPSGSILQKAFKEGAGISSTTLNQEIISIDFTPKASDSILECEISFHWGDGGSNSLQQGSFFVDGVQVTGDIWYNNINTTTNNARINTHHRLYLAAENTNSRTISNRITLQQNGPSAIGSPAISVTEIAQSDYTLAGGGGGGSSSGGGSSTFEDLTDTPSSFVGESGKFVKVNDTEDALEFTTFNVNDALGLQEVDGEDNCSEFHLQSDKTTNSSVFEDSSVNNYSILGSNVIHNTSNPKAGFGSSSIQFNGNGQLLVADGSAFKFFHTKIIKNYTIQLWIFKDALNSREPLLLTAANNNEHGVRLIVDSDNKVKFDVMKGLSNATGLSLASAATISAQTWHHVAIVNENNTMTLYLDGNQEQSLAWTSDGSTITPNFGLSIGAGPMGAGQAMVFFNGRMQDIRVDKIAFRSDLLPPTSLLNATCDPSAGKSNIDFKMLRDTPVNYSNAGGKYVKVKDGEDGVEFVEISVGSSTTNEFSTAYVTQDQTSDGFITDLEFGNLVVGRTYRISSTICFESNDASALSRADFYNGTQRIVSLYNKGLTSTVSNSMLFVASDSSISVSGNGLTSNNFIHGLPELSFVQLELPPSVVVEIEDIPVAPVAPPGGGIFSVNDVKMHAGIIDYQDSSNTFSDIDSNAFGGNIIDVSDIRLISKIDNTGDQKTFEDLDSRLTSIDKLDLADIRVITQIDYTGHSRTFEDFDSSLTSFGVLSFADMIINTKIYSTGTDSVMTTDPYTSHDHSFSWTGIN